MIEIVVPPIDPVLTHLDKWIAEEYESILARELDRLRTQLVAVSYQGATGGLKQGWENQRRTVSTASFATPQPLAYSAL